MILVCVFQSNSLRSINCFVDVIQRGRRVKMGSTSRAKSLLAKGGEPSLQQFSGFSDFDLGSIRLKRRKVAVDSLFGVKISMSAEGDLQEPLLERLSATPEADDSAKSSKKRKRGADFERSAKRTAKTAKKPKSRKAKVDEDNEIDPEAGINKAFAHMDSQLLADYVAQRTRKHETNLSFVELEDKYIPGPW